MSYSVAGVGATGNVGREMLSILEERQFPVSEVHALASAYGWAEREILGMSEARRAAYVARVAP